MSIYRVLLIFMDRVQEQALFRSRLFFLKSITSIPIRDSHVDSLLVLHGRLFHWQSIDLEVDLGTIFALSKHGS